MQNTVETSAARLRKIYARFVEEREQQGIVNQPVNLNDVYELAYKLGWREPKPDPRARFRKDMARALREDHFTDMKGRTVRRYHARKRVYIDDFGVYVQEVFWDDMLNEPPPDMDFLIPSFMQRRSQIGGELHQLKNDVDHANDRHPDEPPIKMLWDFTEDLSDQDQPTEYTVPPMDDDMPKVSPFHSKAEPIHHNNSRCGPGSEIAPKNKITGTGGKPLCEDCQKLGSEGK